MSKTLPRNSRLHRIAKWIAQQANPLVTELLLETDSGADNDNGTERLATWVRDKSFVPHEIAEEIEELLSGVATEAERKIAARLVWVTDKGARWTSFPLQIEPEGGVTQAFDGTQKNLLVQQQRHIEGIALTYFKATEAVLGTYRTTLESLTKLIDARETRSADLEVEIARLRDENSTLQAQHLEASQVATQAVEAAESAAEELEKTRETSAKDGQMLTLLTKVAGDMAAKKQA